jgi:hypothetical protein
MEYQPTPDYMTKTQPVSSRRTKTESKKAMRQSLILLGVSVILLIAFIFVILPAVIKFAARGGDVASNVKDELPPQMPMISAPVTATFSATLKINGYGEKESEIIALNNGNEVARETITDEQGKFEFDLPLQDGENSVSFYAADKSGNESEATKAYFILFDNKVPTIELETPTDGQQIELRKNQNMTVKGKTEAEAKVYVNGRLTRANADGIFTTTMLLNEGENTIALKAEDQAGNFTEKTIKVNFKF